MTLLWVSNLFISISLSLMRSTIHKYPCFVVPSTFHHALAMWLAFHTLRYYLFFPQYIKLSMFFSFDIYIISKIFKNFKFFNILNLMLNHASGTRTRIWSVKGSYPRPVRRWRVIRGSYRTAFRKRGKLRIISKNDFLGLDLNQTSAPASMHYTILLKLLGIK